MRIIHFSDFHLDATKIERAKTIVKRMIESLTDIHKESPIDLILFSGDLIDCAGKSFGESEMQTAFQTFQDIVIDPITSALTLPPYRFVFTLGNHEINGATVDKDEDKELTEQLQSHNEVDRYMHQSELLIPRISEYNIFRDAFWSNFPNEIEIKSSVFNACLKFNINGKKIGVNCLNTVWRCTEEDGKNNLLLGKSQVTDNRDFFEDCNIRLSIGHHHPNMMQEFEKTTIKQLFAQNYDAFFCGHTHDIDVEYSDRPQGSCFYFTAPGTLFGNISADSKYKNGFMVIDFEQDYRYVKTKCYFQNDNEDFVIDKNYGENGVWHKAMPGSTIIKPMHLSLFEQKINSDFLHNMVIDDCINQLQNPEIDFIQLVALSGLGKTRILREAFDDGKSHENYFYCEFSDNQIGLMYDVETIIQEHKGQTGLIVLDNCPNNIFEDVIVKRKSYDSMFRIIGVNNEYYDRTNLSGLNVTQIFLNQDQMRDMVNDFVDKSIPVINGDMSARDLIKKIADGFPGMAIDLVRNFKEGQGNIDIHRVDHFINKLLKFEKGHEEEQRMVLCSLALFQPCPYDNEYKKAFMFIRDNESITPLYNYSQEQKRHVFSHTIDRYDKSLIEISESWLTVRPFPLANWLVNKWFADDNDPERFEQIVADIENLDEPYREVIKNGLCKRLEYMQDSAPAQEMILLLTTGERAPFCNEKVVCSDLGSRLFLAMSSVNPVAVAKCLYNVLSPKPIEWVKEYIDGDVRRNLVWALEKLCFNKDSYNYASKIMALFAIAENETWTNNASGQFSQLFHILLPGTEADLSERLNILHYLKDNGEGYRDLLLNSIDRAFDDRDFIRSGSANQFGLHKKEDYVPTKQEIVNYWKGCNLILQELLDKDKTTLDRIAKIAVSHVLRWSFNGMLERQFSLLTRIAELKGGLWQEMYDAMQKNNSKRLAFYSEDFLSQLDAFRAQIRPNYFCQKLKDARQEVYNDYSAPMEEQIQHERELFHQLAVEFIEQGFYKSYDEVKQIVGDEDFFDTYFSSELHNIMTDEQVSDILAIFLKLIPENGGDTFIGRFVFSFCSVFRNHERVRNFISEIHEKGYHSLFMRLLANCETAQFDSYQTMRNMYSKGDLEQDAPAAYLENVSIPLSSRWNDIIKMFYKDFPKSSLSLMNFFIRHQFNTEILNDTEILEIVKTVILEYPINETDNNPLHEYIRYTTGLLGKYHDEDFAIKVNRKIMETLKSQFSHRDLEDIYPVLITQYTDAIWPDFEKAFSNQEYYFFLYRIKNTIGSGSGFGEGPLFMIGDEKIKDLCLKNPQFAPSVIAEMCPIFHSDNKGKETRFHDWVLWLLDQFGDMDNVLSGLHANMGSFAWTGSVIPLLIHKKKCFEEIQNHKNIKVRKWVESCLREIEAELSRERNREEYMRLLYN